MTEDCYCDQDGPCDNCIDRSSIRQPEWWTVAVYEIECAYGGPEEGGWWYDAGYIIDRNPPMHFFTREEAVAARNQLQVFIDLFVNAHRRHYRSVVGDPQQRAMIYQGHAPQYFPAVRPHYE